MSIENEIVEKLKDIFGVEVTFDLQSAAQEQAKLWVEIETPRVRITSGIQTARVTGTAIMYAQNEKATLGMMARAIEVAPESLTKNFFFEEPDGNSREYRNIVGRGFRFTYFFRGQFNPPAGTISEVDFKE